jgi:hypothetical protein
MNTNGTPPLTTGEPTSARPEIEEMISEVLACSSEDKRVVLYRLLRDMLGEQAADQYGIYHPEGGSYLFLVSPRLHASLGVTPERLAQWRRDVESGTRIPLTETIARMESQSQ